MIPPHVTRYNSKMNDSLDLRNPDGMNACTKIQVTGKEITEIDMRLLGNIVYGKAITLSEKINTDLLEPISRWLDNPDWMSKFEIIESQIPNWASYKQKAREWTAQQRRLAADRLKIYWRELRKKRNFRRKLSEIIGTKTTNTKYTNTPMRKCGIFEENFLSPIISPFSPEKQHEAETQREFQQALGLSVSDLLPWKLLMLNDLSQPISFTALKTYYPENRKKDTVSKLIHLLQMETDGMLKLTQKEHLGDITIEPLENDQEGTIEIKDRHGLDYKFDWHHLSDNQKTKIIADIKKNKIICKHETIQ